MHEQQTASIIFPGEMPVTQFHFGRSECSLFAQAVKREWLVTNGIGGFASSTVCDTIRAAITDYSRLLFPRR